MKALTTVTVILITTVVLFAAAPTVDDLKTQLAALEQQIITLRQQLHQSPEYQQLQQAAATAATTYNDALSNDPQINDLNTQIAALRDQLRNLMQKKIARETELDATTLADKKAASDAAAETLRNAGHSGDLGQALQQRDQLLAQIAQQTK